MTIDRAGLAAWCQDKLESHASSKSTILDQLTDFGIEVSTATDRYGTYALLSGKGRQVKVRCNTWDDDLQAMIARRRQGRRVLLREDRAAGHHLRRRREPEGEEGLEDLCRDQGGRAAGRLVRKLAQGHTRVPG